MCFLSTGNNQFVTICGFTPASPPSSFTVFDLVEPAMMNDLFQVFLFALTDEELIGKSRNNKQEVQYQSITIPCRNFSTMPVPFHITVRNFEKRVLSMLSPFVTSSHFTSFPSAYSHVRRRPQ